MQMPALRARDIAKYIRGEGQGEAGFRRSLQESLEAEGWIENTRLHLLPSGDVLLDHDHVGPRRLQQLHNTAFPSTTRFTLAPQCTIHSGERAKGGSLTLSCTEAAVTPMSGILRTRNTTPPSQPTKPFRRQSQVKRASDGSFKNCNVKVMPHQYVSVSPSHTNDADEPQMTLLALADAFNAKSVANVCENCTKTD